MDGSALSEVVVATKTRSFAVSPSVPTLVRTSHVPNSVSVWYFNANGINRKTIALFFVYTITSLK